MSLFKERGFIIFLILSLVAFLYFYSPSFTGMVIRTEGGGGYTPCIEVWECSGNFSMCINETRMQECYGTYGCGAEYINRTIVEECVPSYYEMNNSLVFSLLEQQMTTINASDILFEITSNVNLSSMGMVIERQNNLSAGEIKIVRVNASNLTFYFYNKTMYIFYDEIVDYSESSFELYEYIDNWSLLNSTLDTDKNYIVATFSDFGMFGILGEKIQAIESGPPQSPQGGSSRGVIRARNCDEDWICSGWSECKNGFKTRRCSDSNNCGTAVKKPVTSISCSVDQKENKEERVLPLEEKIVQETNKSVSKSGPTGFVVKEIVSNAKLQPPILIALFIDLLLIFFIIIKKRKKGMC